MKPEMFNNNEENNVEKKENKIVFSPAPAKLSPGIYDAEIIDYEVRKNENTPFGVKDVIQFKLKVNGEFMSKKVTISNHRMSTLNKLHECITGKRLGNEFDPDDLIGSWVCVEVINKPNDDGDEYAVITDFHPMQYDLEEGAI
jgi:hypothetical protein